MNSTEESIVDREMRGRLRLLALVVAALLVALLLAEGLVRLADAAGLVNLAPSLEELALPAELEDQVNLAQAPGERTLYLADPKLHHRMAANWMGVFPEEIMQQVGRSRVSIRTNSLGLRGPEPAAPKPDDLFRIVVLGDSVTFGWGVAEEDAYPSQLANLLATLRPEQRFEVLNAGISGYGTWQELGWLEELGAQLQPDLVIVQVHLNDAADNLWGTIGWEQGDWLTRNSMAMRLIRQILQANRAAGGSGTCERDWAEGRERVCWEETTALLGDLEDQAAGLGAPLVILAAPMRWQVETNVKDPRVWVDEARYQAELARWAGQQGILFVDPLAAIRAQAGATGLSLFLDVGHPNEAGHRIMAQALYSAMAQAGLLP